jgi:hypothetical protein
MGDLRTSGVCLTVSMQCLREQGSEAVLDFAFYLIRNDVFFIRIRILPYNQCCGSGSVCFRGLLDPDPYVRGMDPDPFIIKQK